MSKEDLDEKLKDALDCFWHQSSQVATNEESLELSKAVYRLMDEFRESIIEYLQ